MAEIRKNHGGSWDHPLGTTPIKIYGLDYLQFKAISKQRDDLVFSNPNSKHL